LWIEIYDIQKDQTIVAEELLGDYINSMVFTQDNMGAYMMPYQMPLTLLKWDQPQIGNPPFPVAAPQMFEDVVSEDTAAMCLLKNGSIVFMNDGNI